MTNEIKEIQERLNYHKSIGIEPEYCEDLITTGELQRLLDYITNLQEENERLRNLYTDERKYKIDCDYFKVLYSKTDKDIVIEDLVFKCEHCYYLHTALDKIVAKNRNLLYQIDKANQLIEKQKKKMYKSRNKIAMYILMNLENILRGDE